MAILNTEPTTCSSSRRRQMIRCFELSTAKYKQTKVSQIACPSSPSFLLFHFLSSFFSLQSLISRVKRQCPCAQIQPNQCQCTPVGNVQRCLCTAPSKQSQSCTCASKAQSTVCQPTCQKTCVQSCSMSQPAPACQSTCKFTCSQACNQRNPSQPIKVVVSQQSSVSQCAPVCENKCSQACATQANPTYCANQCQQSCEPSCVKAGPAPTAQPVYQVSFHSLPYTYQVLIGCHPTTTTTTGSNSSSMSTRLPTCL